MEDEQEIKSGSRVGPLAFSGDYVELGDVIGTGAQGQVFACRREKSDARLAAKVVDCHRLQLSADEPDIVVKKMENEVRILRNAEHEHCVSLYDIYRTPRWIVLIMERLEGGELFEQIAKKRTLKELEAKHVFQQLVSGLVFLHGKKIAHRDLKPENVLIAKMRQADPPNEDCTLYDIKIADYGLSKYNDEGEPLRSMVGTPQYWAPEMLKAKGRQGYDERVDLWSLGVLLYVMLYGRYPFRGDNANEQIKNGTFELSRAKSPPSEDAQDLIRKLLKVNPGDRLPLSGCLEHPWLVGEKKKAPSPPQPASAVAVRAVTPRAPFDLRELLRLQVSLGRSLEIACLACRSQHPELAASIRETIMQAQLLWQQAVKVIGQYAQVSRKVIETVLPDLNLAVQESVPELGYDLLSMVESWIQKMTADSEKMHWLCTELSKHLEKMIHQAQAQQLQLQAAAPEARAPQPPNAICDAGSQATPQRRQDLFDELELFANKISRGTYSDAAEEGKTRELVDLLFLSPGFGPGALKALEAPAETGETSRELRDQKTRSTGDPTPTSMAPESLSPEPSAAAEPSAEASKDPNELALCTTGGEVNRYQNYHSTPYVPLLRALYQLRSVSNILQECTAFWGHIESTVQELARTKDHTQTLLRHAAKSSGLKERFDQRLGEYGAFWATLLKLCEQYCQEVQPELNKMMVDVRNAEAAADAFAAGLGHRLEEAR